MFPKSTRLTFLYSVLTIVAISSPTLADESTARQYKFAQSPLEIMDRLPELQMGPCHLADDERKLLAEFWKLRGKSAGPADLKFDENQLLEAMLLASGVDAPEKRDLYRKKIIQLVDEARKATKSARSQRERGEMLMSFLHAGVMNKGYDAAQTSLTAIFDTHQANCVSAAALYYVVGTRLGLELRPISIPGGFFMSGHASLDMIDGDKRIQVEPTNPNGFDWQKKTSGAAATSWGGPVPDRKDGHEVDGPAVAAMIYSNRGLALIKSDHPQRLEAIGCFLAALCLDPADEQITKNVLAAFVNWGPELAAKNEFESAVRVMELGRAIAPTDNDVKNNRRVVWSRYIENLLQAGKDREARSIIDRAGKATGDEEWQRPSHWFIQHGHNRLKDGWEAGLAVVDRGLKVMSATEAQALRKWRSNMFRRRSQDLLSEKQDIDGSLSVLARAYALDPKDQNIFDGLEFHTQEALRILDGKGGRSAAIEHYQLVRKRLPAVDGISKVGRSFAQSAVNQLVEQNKFPEAVAAVGECQPFLSTTEERAELGGMAYGQWAKDIADRKEWKASLDKCAEGLRIYPQQSRLVDRIRITVDAWAAAPIANKAWDEAISTYNVGLGYLADDSHLKYNRRYCQDMKEGN